MISAKFFPADPEGLLHEMQATAQPYLQAGLRLYCDGKRFALLPKPINGWKLWRVNKCVA